MSSDERVITLTFGDHAENHVGMEMIGVDGVDVHGLEHEDLVRIASSFRDCELVNLKDGLEMDTDEEAWLLIIRGGVGQLVDLDAAFEEVSGVSVDTKYFDRRRKRVLNKHARYNTCFSDFAQEASFEEGKGTVHDFADYPALSELRGKISDLVGVSTPLPAELNDYYDRSKCKIGWHGDGERKVVVGCRFGTDFGLAYRWYHRSKPVSDIIPFELHHGDMYFMSAKAVGRDWCHSSKITLRHSAAMSFA